MRLFVVNHLYPNIAIHPHPLLPKPGSPKLLACVDMLHVFVLKDLFNLEEAVVLGKSFATARRTTPMISDQNIHLG